MNRSDIGLIIGHASDVGRVREINEDSYLALTPPSTAPDIYGVMMVADGVGGANAGEVASGILVELFWHWFVENNYADLVHYNPGHDDYYIAVLKELLEYANESLFDLASTDSHLSEMGTTGTIGILTRGRLFVGHVGDTRAYLLRQGNLSQLTVDHSWVNEELLAGRLSSEQARSHPKRNVVSRVIGASSLLRVERKAFPIQNGDILILTSDGLTGAVEDAEIRQMVLSSSDPQNACERLIDLANERGGHDNVTVLISHVKTDQGDSNLKDGFALQSFYLQGQMNQKTAIGTNESKRPQMKGLDKEQETRSNSREMSIFAGISVVVGILSGTAYLFITVALADTEVTDAAYAAFSGFLVVLGLWCGYTWRSRREQKRFNR